jgi:hypothetical protein
MRSAVSPTPPPSAAERRASPPSRRPPPRAGARRAALPRELRLACLGGVLLGTAAAVTAFWSYLSAGGPTVAGVAVIPGSLLVVAVAYAVLARRGRRTSDWLGLGYTAAVVVVTALLMVWEVLRGFYAELSFAAW